MHKTIKIKNNQAQSDTYCGVTIGAGEYHLIPSETERILFAENPKVNEHLWSTPAKIIVNDGVNDLTNQVEGEWYLQELHPLEDFFLETTCGHVSGKKVMLKFGRNPSVNADDFEDIWCMGGDYIFLADAQTVNVKSTSTNDVNTTGTGAWEVELMGLDASYDEISETVQLNGTTDVLSTNSYLRLFRAKVKLAGSLGYNDGDITTTSSSTEDIIGHITATDNQTLQAIYTIPAGYTGYLYDYYAGVALNMQPQVKLFVKPYGEVFQLKHTYDGCDGVTILKFPFPQKITEKSDIKLRAKNTTGTCPISGGFNLVLVEN